MLDEAHNIEDCCREAGSYSVLYDDIFQSMKDCKRVASMGILPEIHNSLVQNYYCIAEYACLCVYFIILNSKEYSSCNEGDLAKF